MILTDQINQITRFRRRIALTCLPRFDRSGRNVENRCKTLLRQIQGFSFLCNINFGKTSFANQSSGTRDLRDVRNSDAVPLPAPGADESKQQTFDLASLIEQLQKNPELANTLAALIANGSNPSC